MSSIILENIPNKIVNYHSIQNFNNGKMYFNMYIGNVIGIFTISEKIPLDLIINSSDVVKYGNEYKLNYSEKLEIRELDGFKYIAHIDYLSKIHHYYKSINKSDIYYNENNNNLILKEDENYFYIMDKENNKKKTFIKTNTNYCFLSEIEEESNHIKLELDKNYRIIKIKNNNNVIDIEYKENTITKIKELENYLYELDNNVSQIKTNKGTTTLIYNNEKLIARIKEENGYMFEYKYHNDLPYTIKKISKYNSFGELENTYTFQYNLNETEIIDNKGNKDILKFDNLGNLLSENKFEI